MMSPIEENIAEIAMYVGAMIQKGKIDKEGKDLSSTDISEMIISWAREFEENPRGEHYIIDSTGDFIEPFGYLDAIDSFTEKKCIQVGWINKE